MKLEINALVPLLQVYDMPASLEFYRDVLGFEIVEASPVVDAPEGRFSHWVWLKLGSANLMLNTAYDEGRRPNSKDPERERWHSDVTLYFSCRDVDYVHRTLLTKLPDLEPPANAPYGKRQLGLSDPDGYKLCFQAPIMKS